MRLPTYLATCLLAGAIGCASATHAARAADDPAADGQHDFDFNIGVWRTHIRRVLDERPGHRAPRVRFETELEDQLSEEDAAETLQTVISWGRYGELFSYDDQAEVFSLDNPT